MYYRLLVHILDNRWSSYSFVDKDLRLLKLIFIYNNQLHIFTFMLDILSLKKQGIRDVSTERKIFNIYMKKLYKINLRRELRLWL